jgi:hypothetical protein
MERVRVFEREGGAPSFRWLLFSKIRKYLGMNAGSENENDPKSCLILAGLFKDLLLTF